jgi:hypothetical protein
LRSFTRKIAQAAIIADFNYLVTADGDNLTDAEGNFLYINQI